jgi:ribosome-associated protein
MVKVLNEIDSQLLSEVIVEGMKNNKAEDIVIIDLRDVEHAVTDFFVICSGDSPTQIEGTASSVVRLTRKELKEKPWHKEGKNNPQWILLDYVNVVVHIFHKELREYYELEDLWADGKKLIVEDN